MARVDRSKPAQRAATTVRQQGDLRSNIVQRAQGLPALLESFIYGTLRGPPNPDGTPGELVELTAQRLTAIKLLLERSVPVLSAVEWSDDKGDVPQTPGELRERLAEMALADPKLLETVLSRASPETLKGLETTLLGDKVQVNRSHLTEPPSEGEVRARLPERETKATEPETNPPSAPNELAGSPVLDAEAAASGSTESNAEPETPPNPKEQGA